MKSIYAIMAVVLSLMAPLALTGCGGGGSADETSTSTGTAVTTTPGNMTSPTMTNKAAAFAHQHHKAVGVVTAIGTYKALKNAGAKQQMNGHKMNFATRHPLATAIGAGLLANHMAKKHLH